MPRGYPARALAVAAPGMGPRYQPLPSNPARPGTSGHGNIRPGRVLRMARRMAAASWAGELAHMAEYAYNVHLNASNFPIIPGMQLNGWHLVKACGGGAAVQQTGLGRIPGGCFPTQALSNWATPRFGSAISVSGTGARWLRAYSQYKIYPSGDARHDEGLGFQKSAGTTVTRGPLWLPGLQVIPVPGSNYSPGTRAPPVVPAMTGVWPWAVWDPYSIPVRQPGATPAPIPWALAPYIGTHAPAGAGAYPERWQGGYAPPIIGGGTVTPPIVGTPPVVVPPVVVPGTPPVVVPWVSAPTIVVSNKGVRATTQTHAIRAPWPGEKEIKARFMRHTRPLRLLMDASSETEDVVDALWRALPKGCQTRVKGVKTSFGQKSADVYACWDHMDATRMLKELLRNEIIDFIYGNEDGYVKWFNQRFGLLSSGQAFEAIKDYDWEPGNDQSSYSDAFGSTVSDSVGELVDFIFGP